MFNNIMYFNHIYINFPNVWRLVCRLLPWIESAGLAMHHVDHFFPFSFLTDSSTWSQCLEPAHVVEWNIILFSILIALSGFK